MGLKSDMTEFSLCRATKHIEINSKRCLNVAEAVFVIRVKGKMGLPKSGSTSIHRLPAATVQKVLARSPNSERRVLKNAATIYYYYYLFI